MKKNMKGMKKMAVCGFCGKINRYGHPTDNGWIFMKSYYGNPINTWFHSEECKQRQIYAWQGKYLKAFHPIQAKIVEKICLITNIEKR